MLHHTSKLSVFNDLPWTFSSVDRTIAFMLKLNALFNLLLPLLKIIGTVSLLTASHSSFAEQWYHVELIVFEQLDSTSDEKAPIATIPDTFHTPDSTEDLIQPAANETLTDSAAKLEKSGRYQVHYHQSWKQPIETKANAKSVSIASGMIEGRILLHKGTYLYATVDLQLDRPDQISEWSDSAEMRKPYLKESRRVRSDKLQYFDHPHMGALLKLTPIDSVPVIL
jgi:hypothetical protein